MEGCQYRVYIWSVSAVFPRALGRGDVNPVKGEQPLEFSLDRIFPPLRDSNVLEANNRGPLLENPMYFLFTSLVSVWAYVPCYCSFHCVGGNRASPPKVHEPFGWKSLVGVRGIEFQPALPSRENGGETVLLFSGVRSCKSKYILR